VWVSVAIIFFVCKKSCISSVFFQIISSVAMYEVSNLAESEIPKHHHFSNQANNVGGEKCGYHFPLRALFGSSMDGCLNQDILLQPVQPLSQMSLSDSILSTKLSFCI